MQRPVMDPLFVDTPEPDIQRGPGVRAQLRRALRLILRGFWTLATVDLLVWRPAPKVAEAPDHRLARLAHGVIGKLAILPAAVLIAVAALSWIATHPPEPATDVSAQLGIYHEPIGLVSEDGVRLEAFLVQPISAERVLAERDRAIGRRYRSSSSTTTPPTPRRCRRTWPRCAMPAMSCSRSTCAARREARRRRGRLD